MRKTIKVSLLLRFCLFAFLMIGLLFSFTYTSPVGAEAYLKISSGELVFVSEIKNDWQYYFEFEYQGAENLPQSPSSVYGIDGDVYLKTDDDDEIHLMYVQGYKTTTHIQFIFDNVSKAFVNANVQSFTIPSGLTLQKSSSVTSEYAGIVFDGDMTFVKKDGGWVCERKEPPTYTIELTENLSVPEWNEKENTLQATLNVPFAPSQDLAYEGSLLASCDRYVGNVTATQKAGESTVYLSFSDSTTLKDCTGLALTLSSGELTSGEAKLAVMGTQIFYGYSDGSWLKEERREITCLVDGATSIEKIPITQTSYTFKSLASGTKRIFVGWKLENELYFPNETVTLTAKNVVLEAVFMNYGLREGASVRCDEAGLDRSGIRFIAELQENAFETHKDYLHGVGVIVLPADKLENGRTFTWANYNGANQAKNFFVEADCISFNQDGIFQLYATVIDVIESNYNRDFIARAYAVIGTGNGESYLYSDDIEKRSVYTVATKALMSTEYVFEDWEIKILEKYVNGVANVNYEKGNATVVCAAQNPIISEASVFMENKTVTLRLKTAVEHFAAIIFNGERIRDAVQSYDSENGCLVVTFSKEI